MNVLKPSKQAIFCSFRIQMPSQNVKVHQASSPKCVVNGFCANSVAVRSEIEEGFDGGLLSYRSKGPKWERR
jgi:hypothetical protein